ncbi:MAG: 50S ribosomal protein L22 [Alphaproteobacteria bacterium]|nr:MAG: 50S ribosomal protein L22 [Rickettsiaceae bacterium 4572_127]
MKKQVRCFVKMIKTSPRKLNLVAGTIRKKSVGNAINSLVLSKKRIAEVVRKAVLSAVANAENNYGLNPEKLEIVEAYVGKAMTLKRIRAGSRGQAKKILKPFASLTVVVAEKTIEKKKKKVSRVEKKLS